MRKLLIVSALLLFAGIVFGQTLQKGGSFGLHVLTINLAPEVTMDQYLDFIVNKFIPEAEKQFEGVKVIVMKGDRGDHENKIVLVNYFESEKDRDRYFPEEGKRSDECEAAREKVQPLLDELQKMGTWSGEHNSWVIQ